MKVNDGNGSSSGGGIELKNWTVTKGPYEIGGDTVKGGGEVG